MTNTFVDDEGRYRLDSRIATGGMGEVWRATDTVLDRVVAIKILKPEYADDPTFRSRFETEARHAAALHHPGVAAVYDSGEGRGFEGGPRPFLVMEYVDGEPLSNLLRPNAPMDPEVARDLIARAADAVGAAHAAGIVHRDLKPANLLVTPDRTIKITDFGIARAADGMALTATGQVMGTPQYLSPEQAEGGTATPASDVYSLAVVLFECLAGYRPFVGDTPVTTALAHVREPVPQLPDFVPAGLAAVVTRALAKDPEARFANGTQFAAALRDPSSLRAQSPLFVPPPVPAPAETQVIPATAAVPVAPVDPVDPAPEKRGRTPAWVWVVLSLLVIVIVAILLWTQSGSGDDEPTSPTSPSDSSSATSSAPTTASSSAPTEVTVNAADYIGRNVDEVAQELRDLGLRVSTQRIDNPGDEEVDTVEDVNPDGDLVVGDSVNVTYWGTPTPTTPPTTPTTPPTTPTEPPTSDSTEGAGESSPSDDPDDVTEAPDGGEDGTGVGDGRTTQAGAEPALFPGISASNGKGSNG